MPRTWGIAAMCCQSHHSCHYPDSVTFLDQVAPHRWQTCWLALSLVPSMIQVSPPSL